MGEEIEELTEEQEALLPVYRDKWIDIGLNTDPCDVENAKRCVNMAYESAKADPPKRFFYFRSPVAGAIAAQLLMENDHLKVDEQELIEKVEASYKFEGGELLLSDGLKKSDIQARIGEQAFGNHDAYWLSYYDYFLEVFGLECVKPLAGLIELAKYCGWWAPYSEVAILQDRPLSIKFDQENLLHCEDGPAILYRDGYAIYAIHGVKIPGEWIEQGIDPEVAVNWPNMEERNAAVIVAGWKKILDKLGAVVVDKDPDPLIGTLWECKIPDAGLKRFLEVTCGTGRENIVLNVPMKVKTALEANAWTYPIATQEIIKNLEVRT